MYILKILVQHKIYSLNKPFVYFSNVKISRGCRVAINFRNQEIVGFVDEVTFYDGSKEQYSKEYGFTIKEIDEIIDTDPILNDELLKLATTLSSYYLYPLIGVLQTMLPPSLTPKDTTYNAPKIKYQDYYELNGNIDINLYNKIFQKILKKFDGRPLIKTSEFNKSKSLDILIEEGVIVKKRYEVTRYDLHKTFEYENEITLNEEQQIAFNEIVNGVNKTYLLKGVTGSGKTEVYFKLIENTINKGKSVILLVPEIALTPLMVSRVLSYFTCGVAVLNSSLTSAQKYDEYRKIANGEAQIVIGTRSAIFAPNVNLGLIIIDEEHDESYKQDDQSLLYNAKEVALIRAKDKDVKVLFGSATPSIEMMAKTQNGQIKLVELKNRYNNIELPEVFVVNKSDKNNYQKGYEAFSDLMIDKIREKLKNNDQIILLMNSRGYSKNLVCTHCGYVFKCPNCGLPLYYHKNNNVLFCHHCDYKMTKPKICPDCSSQEFKLGSFGIEKVEEEFKKIFNVPYIVMDSDRVKTGKQIEKALNEFNQKKAHVLIGTQIVSKGHDFKDVSFVGVINADLILNYPNYRNKEMTFNLLAQTIGRAGRKNKRGEAIIQTSFVDDYAIQSAIKQDYDSFYEKEILSRKKLQNPPFTSVCALDITCKNCSSLGAFAKQIIAFLNSQKLENTIIQGPSYIQFKNKQYFTQVFIKYKKLSVVKDTIESLLNVYGTNYNVSIKINFNPYSF